MKLPEPPCRRPWDPSDDSERHLVLSGFLRTYVDQSAGIERTVLFRLCEPVVESLMARAHVDVACLQDDPTAILGWVMTEGEDLLHYVCVKPRWQRLGVGIWLLGPYMDRDMIMTHRTERGMRLALPERWKYAPHMRFEARKVA